MNRLRSISLSLLIVLLSATCVFAIGAGVGRDGTIAATKGKAKTLAELIEMYDSTACIDCHEEIHDDWAASPHARPMYGTGRTAATMITAMKNGFMSWAYSGVNGPEDVKVEHLMGCAKCHLPQLADAEDSVAVELVHTLYDWYDAAKAGKTEERAKYEETLLALNINCLICHNRMAITHKWTDGYPQSDTVYGFNEGEHEDEHFTKMKVSPIMNESIFCGQCHGLGPNFELENPTQCATLYGSYLWSYVAEGGHERCQECHMEKSGLGHKILSYSDPTMQEMAVDFDVEAFATRWRDGSKLTPKTILKVKMTNRAGHAIPDG